MDIWRWQTLVGILILCLWHIRNIGHPKSFAIAYYYFLISGIITTFFHYKPLNISTLQIDESAAKAVILLLLIPALVMFMSDREFKILKKIIMILAFLNSLILVKFGYGMMGAHSFDTAFIAMVLPAMIPAKWKWHSFIWIGVPIGAILYSTGSTAFLILAACAFVWMLTKKKYLMACSSTSLVIGVGWYVAGNFTSSGRIEAWQYFMEHWFKFFNHYWGTGLGTFQWIGPLMQMKEELLFQDQTSRYFLWMHNDYLQILFEGGIIGLGLFLWVCVDCIRMSRNNTRLLICVVAALASMLTYYPLHWFLTQLWLTSLVRECSENSPVPPKLS